MDDKRKDDTRGMTDVEVSESHTVSQTGRDTDGRSPDYDVSLDKGGDVVRDGVVQNDAGKGGAA